MQSIRNSMGLWCVFRWVLRCRSGPPGATAVTVRRPRRLIGVPGRRGLSWVRQCRTLMKVINLILSADGLLTRRLRCRMLRCWIWRIPRCWRLELVVGPSLSATRPLAGLVRQSIRTMAPKRVISRVVCWLEAVYELRGPTVLSRDD